MPFGYCALRGLVYAVGGGKEDFIHVFSHIMQGRTIEQRKDLSKRIVSELTDMFPTIHRIATNVAEFEKATYLNRIMLQARRLSYAGIVARIAAFKLKGDGE